VGREGLQRSVEKQKQKQKTMDVWGSPATLGTRAQAIAYACLSVLGLRSRLRFGRVSKGLAWGRIGSQVVMGE
jgi:hypothetical protein